MVPGKLAWKAIRRKVRDTIYKEAVNFIFQLNKDTKENTLLDKDKLESLFERDLQRFNKITCINNELKNNILKMISIIKDRLLGRKIWLVASHGDYGYGNILVDPDTGRLQGVIDWDTGRKEELPWIDMLNMAIQNEKSNNSNRLSGAVRAIASGIPFAGLINNCSVYDREFKVGNGVLKILFYIALIRYMSRAAQYETNFIAEQNEYVESFNYLNNVLPL
jgi:thiamine kinase-like enzyme